LLWEKKKNELAYNYYFFPENRFLLTLTTTVVGNKAGLKMLGMARSEEFESGVIGVLSLLLRK
jgi:hypothetical protein